MRSTGHELDDSTAAAVTLAAAVHQRFIVMSAKRRTSEDRLRMISGLVVQVPNTSTMERLECYHSQTTASAKSASVMA